MIKTSLRKSKLYHLLLSMLYFVQKLKLLHTSLKLSETQVQLTEVSIITKKHEVLAEEEEDPQWDIEELFVTSGNEDMICIILSVVTLNICGLSVLRLV